MYVSYFFIISSSIFIFTFIPKLYIMLIFILPGDGSGVRDSCVNQLLSKLDGVDEMNNVLVICLTNRKDLIDSALLRPGRLEVHIEIKAPDLQGREEILYILFKPMVLGGYVSLQDAKSWIHDLARKTFGYTGADLTGIVRNAASYAIERTLDQQHKNYYNSKNVNKRNDKNLNNNDKNEKNILSAENNNQNPISDLIPDQNEMKPFEDSIEILWNDINKAFLESKKDLKISKRAKFLNFLTSTIFKNEKNENKKIKKREFEDILNSIDVEEEEMSFIKHDDNDDDNADDVVDDDDSNQIKPAFRNIGGTLIF